VGARTHHSSAAVHAMKQQKPSKSERADVDAAVDFGIRKTMKRKKFERELTKLQVELVRLQTWVKATGARIIVIFEGRDTAGKGGTLLCRR
jgi:polyphosphate kinase 2 (PPK2 family)